MTARRFGRLTSFWFVCMFCMISRPSNAQDFAHSTLQTYRDLRSALLAEGWKPDVNHGLKTNSGKPLYRFPEVLCGPKICNAKWRAPTGGERLVTILRGDGAEEYRVAPQ